jgi:energy-coupling factor transporter transmembrane protein EcfT
MFAAAMVAPAPTALGSLMIAAAACSWVIMCHPPRRVVVSLALLGLLVFSPYFLLAPLILASASDQGAGWAQALAPPWSVFLHGIAGMLICTATVTTLSASDLRQGLLALPVPGMVAAILLQIVHQTAQLVDETRRVATAIAVRGASSGGLTAIRVLSSLPRVWLPRIIQRAERVGAAMELRGYCDGDLRTFGRSPMRLADAATLVLVLGAIGLALAIRWWEAR